MKIGIDISPIIFGSGVSVYTKNLVEALVKEDKKNQYRLLFYSLRKKLESGDLSLPASVELIKLKLPPSFLELLWNRLHLFPVENFLGEVDVFHSSDWTQPPIKKARLVTTIHDLSFLRWPESTHPRILAVHRRRLAWVKKEADRIIAVSRATKEETIRLLGIEPERITVIHEGTPKDALAFKTSRKKLALVRKRLGIEKPYFLAYGSAAPRKNIGRLIRAFKEMKEKNHFQLVISGEYSGEPVAGVVFTGFLPRQELLDLFSGALALAYPSLYEGFGLPILEAFALGVPVLTSRVSSMTEVAGRAAVLVDPRSEKEIARAMEQIARGGREIKEMVKEGKQRIKLFTWEKTARETIKVYEKTG